LDKNIIVYCDCLEDTQSINVANILVTNYDLYATVLQGGWSAWLQSQK
jgi:rhodanese-related sulfurtransferase